MGEAEKTVFVSYRRSVSRHLARAIAVDLRAHGYDVFFDVDTVDSGEFDRIVLQQIALRRHFVLVLSRGSLERCADEDDWLRREIEAALSQKRNIVPVFEGNFSFSHEAKHLPDRCVTCRASTACPSTTTISTRRWRRCARAFSRSRSWRKNEGDVGTAAPCPYRMITRW